MTGPSWAGENSTFTALDINVPRLSTNQVHAIYIESDCRALTFKNSTFAGGSGSSVHLWQGTDVAADEISRNIIFENCVIDARAGRYPAIIGPGFDNVKFLNCTFYGNGAGQVFTFYGGANILIDGFSAFGCEELIDGECGSAVVRNGTYHGPRIGTASGVKVENVNVTGV